MTASPTSRPLRIGTRRSALARWQAEWVANALRSQAVHVEIVPIDTHGELNATQRVEQLQGVGIFTKEIQRALLDDTIDLAVHSLKDLPTDHVDGIVLSAVPPRASVADVLISRTNVTLSQLPQQSIVGTSSLRRRAQLLHARSDLVMRDIRGNVDTRLKKLHEGQYDALILAEAGLERLGLAAEISERFAASLMLPAVGQGALGLECRGQDQATQQAIKFLNDEITHQAVIAERSLLRGVSGGCLAPVGAWCRYENRQLKLSAAVLSPDGKQRVFAEEVAILADAESLGQSVAEVLLAQGAAELIAQSRPA